jgi:hypothetical protein
MSWGEPKALAPFGEDSPFFGLSIPGDVAVESQVVAQPDPTLASRVIAQLGDGTPLVTRKALGEGQVVLFHVTANAEWSSLPLSACSCPCWNARRPPRRPATPPSSRGHLGPSPRSTPWELSLDTQPGVPGERIAEGQPGPDRPGLMRARTAACRQRDHRRHALRPAPGRRAVRAWTRPRVPLKGAPGAGLGSAPGRVASLLLPGGLRGPRGAVAAFLAPLLPPDRAPQERPAAEARRPRASPPRRPCPRSSRWPRPRRWCWRMC